MKKEKFENKTEDHLTVKRKGGGSIINHRPLFSSNGEILYVIWKQLVRRYSTKTGDFVGEFESADAKLSGISFHPDNSSILGCTECGNLVTWNSQNGLITRKLRLKIPSVKVSTFHVINYSINEIKYSQVLITYRIESERRIELVLFDIDTGEKLESSSFPEIGNYYVDIIGNYGDSLIAFAQDVDLHILQPRRNLASRLHKIGAGGRKLTCVTGHPWEECLAAGDSSGRVAVFRNLLKGRPVWGSYHWHQLPVTEIAFSKSGGHMYTGGSECVLVKWTLGSPHQKSFLPRLPAPIKHLTIAPENVYVAVSTLDNGIVVVDPQRKLTSVIQNFTWGVTASGRDLFPAGMILDPRTGSLVLNSRTGHLQFFDVNKKSLLFNINITGQNFLTQERDTVIVNTEVTRVGMNHDGSWLGTVEERNDRVSSPEVRLKFWRFNRERQNFVLNTCIELPHDFGVNALEFKPSTSLSGDKVSAVTTGRDKKFKLWSLIDGNSKHWACWGTGVYRDAEATDADFAVDGSLLGVGFGPSLTLWTPEDLTLKCSLTHKKYPESIKKIKFGRNEACNLVVVGTAHHLGVWNLLTLSLTWSVELKLSTLCADPSTTNMAAFTSNNSLFVFTPSSPVPVYRRERLLDEGSKTLAACFVPQARSTFCDWQKKSQLFFIDDNQELLTLEDERASGVLMETLGVSTTPGTLFSRLVADETCSSIEREKIVHENFENRGVEELLTLPAHTLPPMRLLCATFILSLRAKNPRDSKRERQSESQSSESYFKLPEVCKSAENFLETGDEKLVSVNWNFLQS